MLHGNPEITGDAVEADRFPGQAAGCSCGKRFSSGPLVRGGERNGRFRRGPGPSWEKNAGPNVRAGHFRMISSGWLRRSPSRSKKKGKERGGPAQFHPRKLRGTLIRGECSLLGAGSRVSASRQRKTRALPRQGLWADLTGAITSAALCTEGQWAGEPRIFGRFF